MGSDSASDLSPNAATKPSLSFRGRLVLRQATGPQLSTTPTSASSPEEDASSGPMSRLSSKSSLRARVRSEMEGGGANLMSRQTSAGSTADDPAEGLVSRQVSESITRSCPISSFRGLLPQTPTRNLRYSPAPDPQVQAMKDICRLQRETMIPMETMQAAMKLFKEHATVPADGTLFTDGFLTNESLAGVTKQLAGSDSTSRSPAGFQSGGAISFREFAIWFSSHSFDENVVLDAKGLELRNLSRELNMDPFEIATLRKRFDSFDINGNGTIDREEFYEMIVQCLRVPKHIGIPAGRLQQLWSDADSDGSGCISFAEFAVFFNKYFPEGGSCGMSQFYSQNGMLNARRLAPR